MAPGSGPSYMGSRGGRTALAQEFTVTELWCRHCTLGQDNRVKPGLKRKDKKKKKGIHGAHLVVIIFKEVYKTLVYSDPVPTFYFRNCQSTVKKSNLLGPVAHICDLSTLGGWGRWITRSGDGDHPGQHSKTLSLLKIQKLVGHGGVCL